MRTFRIQGRVMENWGDCCHSNFSKRPSANIHVKNSEGVKKKKIIIIKSAKNPLQSLRNIEWRTLKTETNRINQMLPYISTNDISELNDLIYAGVKLVSEKIGVPSKSTKKQYKAGWEVRLETQIKNLQKQVKMVNQKDPRICGKRM